MSPSGRDIPGCYRSLTLRHEESPTAMIPDVESCMAISPKRYMSLTVGISFDHCEYLLNYNELFDCTFLGFFSLMSLNCD